MADEDRLFITADEAIGLLPDDVTYIHNTTAGEPVGKSTRGLV